jgi:nitroreductase
VYPFCSLAVRGRIKSIIPHAASFLQNYTDITGGFNKFATEAPFVVVGLYRKSEVIIEKISLMDVTIALQNMVVAGWVQGVGSCWMGAFDESRLRGALNLPADSRIVGAVAFGIPDENPGQPPKKPLSETVHFDRW